MKIDCISDLHGQLPKLDGGDLLIVAGDLTSTHFLKEYDQFKTWFKKQKYRKKILIAGNHDTFLDGNPSRFCTPDWFEYLEDSGTEFEGYKIWGSPWSLSFPGINPICSAFTGQETELAKHFAKIPEDTDILITHSPPFGILDKNDAGIHCGSVSLRNHVMLVKPKIHIFGHIHEQGAKNIDLVCTQFHNVSIMDENYQPKNKPTTINLKEK